jgi:antitoxin ParD1/3/4
MATMNVSLPDAMKTWVESRTEDGAYGNASDYVRDLIRRDRDRVEKIRAMQQLVTEAVESGVSSRSTLTILDKARQTVTADDGL